MRYLICILLLGLAGCEVPTNNKDAIEVDLQQTVDKVKVVITYTHNDSIGSFIVNLESQEELDAYKEQAKFLVEKLEEAQNQWEEKCPLPALHVPSESSGQMAESEEDYEFDESVWGPGPSDDMWYPEEPESPKVTWFQKPEKPWFQDE